MSARVDGAVQDVLSGVQTLSTLVRTPRGAAAVKVVEAALTLILIDVRGERVAGADALALRDLAEAVRVLQGDDDGARARPERYDAGGRETLDRIRDLLGDHGFVAGCLFNVVKYLDRAGKKGDAALDEAKALFYLQAVAHVVKGCPDPRDHRPTFAPYQRDAATTWPPAMLTLAVQVRRDGLPGWPTTTGRFLADLLHAAEKMRGGGR